MKGDAKIEPAPIFKTLHNFLSGVCFRANAAYHSGNWFTLNPAKNQFNTVQFGISTDKVVPADYEGDGERTQRFIVVEPGICCKAQTDFLRCNLA